MMFIYWILSLKNINLCFLLKIVLLAQICDIWFNFVSYKTLILPSTVKKNQNLYLFNIKLEPKAKHTHIHHMKLPLCQTHAPKTAVQDPNFWFHFRVDIWNLWLAHTHTHMDTDMQTQGDVWFRHNGSVVLGRASSGVGVGGACDRVGGAGSGGWWGVVKTQSWLT